MGSGPSAQAIDRPFEPPFMVAEIAKAYGLDAIPGTGAGQVIAIMIDTAPNPADLAAFWSSNGLPPTTVQIVNVGGGPLPGPEGEETLDVAWASGIAPGATIRLYATGSLS